MDKVSRNYSASGLFCRDDEWRYRNTGSVTPLYQYILSVVISEIDVCRKIPLGKKNLNHYH